MISFLRNLLRRNIAAKLVALIVAFVLWGYVMNDQNPSYEGSYTVQVQLVNAPDGYKVTQDKESVKVQVRGQRSLFAAANKKDFKAYVDLSGAESGQKDYKVQVELPSGFELVEIDPDTVSVTLDRITTRQMKAELIVTGSTAPGTTVARVSQPLEQVTLEGPESALDEVARVIGYVGLSGNNSDFQLQVPLTAINSEGREVPNVTVKPATLNVSVQLARGLSKKIVSIKAVAGEGLATNLKLEGMKTDPAKIEIAGPEDVIANINEIDTVPVPLDDVTGSTEKKAELVLPNGVMVTNHEVVVHIVVKNKK